MSSPPHMMLENQICLSLYSATNALIRAYRPFLDPLDLTYPQYLVMLAIWDADNMSVTDICRATRLDTGTVTPLLKRLEAKGLIYRKRSAEDERRRVISLTESGELLRAPASKVPGQMACLNAVSIEEAKQIKLLAEKMYQNIKI
ncbi:MarR family transcriptional regulator [Pseudohongiella nitratireducens]|uniref:MarR family transcriptional regulator n=1 Tax=Pseudohongiella nitratireducens TaxID=1768907 RepID=A0A916VJ97_9GAMM|nr:MarR family transcriptional regulator [Pseudohongiella nitratireducens]MDF1623937.1 MarR family transcriptional regulator [Pseudohongiella nitratireducens]GFZ80104.1 MarR family transcriptional regulator [Pseudohongiella nitratireducens]